MLYQVGGIVEDALKAIDYMLAAKAKLPPVCARLAIMYVDGDSMEKDIFQAYIWLGLALNAGKKDGFEPMLYSALALSEVGAELSEDERARAIV